MEQNKLYCTLTDSELADKAEQWIDKLIKSGGKDFIMCVPARPNEDTDLILAELHQRFLKYCYEYAALQAKCDRYEKAFKNMQKDCARMTEGTYNKEALSILKVFEVSLNKALNGEGEKGPIFPTAVYRQQGSKMEAKKEQPDLGECQRCKKAKATTTYSDLKVCAYCDRKLNDEFDEEYR